MPSARHPKKYPSGTARPVTRAWKERVRLALNANLAAGRPPKNPSELAQMIGAHKTGLLKMLSTEQATYRYASEICTLLGIDEAMVENPVVAHSDLERCIGELRQLSPKRQRQAVAILEALLKQLDVE